MLTPEQTSPQRLIVIERRNHCDLILPTEATKGTFGRSIRFTFAKKAPSIEDGVYLDLVAVARTPTPR